jgi:hypothetical protein
MINERVIQKGKGLREVWGEELPAGCWEQGVWFLAIQGYAHNNILTLVYFSKRPLM